MNGNGLLKNNDGVESNVVEVDKEETIKVRNKSVTVKIKAFEALASERTPNPLKPANWWLGQRNDEEYIRESVLLPNCHEFRSNLNKKASLPSIADDRGRERDSISSNGASSTNSSFPAMLNEVLLKNEKTKLNSCETSVRKSPCVQREDSGYLGSVNESIWSHRNSLYTEVGPQPIPAPRLSRISYHDKSSDYTSHVYEEIIYNDRRISTSSTLSVQIPLPEKNLMYVIIFGTF